MANDILDKYDRGAKVDEPAVAEPDTGAPDIISKYDRQKEAVIKPRLVVTRNEPRGNIADASGFNNRMASSVPILGPLFDKATAAAGATIQPLFVKPKGLSDLVTGEDRLGSQPNWYDRYQANLAMQDERNRLYGEEHPIASTAADITGQAMALGPMAGGPASIAATRVAPAADTLITNATQRMMGMRGNSLGSRFFQGAAGMGALETGNQLLKGNNPLDQGFFGPVPMAMAGGALGPIAGEAISAGGNRLMNWRPRTSGPLAGVNSTGRNMLVNAVEGETPASLAEAQRHFGPSGMLADVNQQTTDLAGGLADVPGAHKGVVREAYRERAGGQKDRIIQSLDKNTVPQVDIAHLGRLIEQDQQTLSKPLYDQFRSMQVQPTPEIKALIPRLEAAGAFSKAEEIAGISGRPFEKKFFTGGSQKEFPTTEAWDLVKRSLDSRISAALDATKPDKNVARELMKLKEDMLNEIDKTPAGPVYKAAREKFAEYATLQEQMKEGGKTFVRNHTADELKYEMSLLTPFEQAARRQGARNEVQNIIENSHLGDTMARNKLLTDAGQKKLEILFGKPKAERLITDLKAELNMSAKKEEVIGGPSTSAKQMRRDLVQPPKIERGYLGNIDLTKPSSFIPDWVTPHAIMEGSSAARYANANNQIAPLLTRKMGDPDFAALVKELLNERGKGEALQNRLAQMGRAVTLGINATVPALRNRLLAPPAMQ